MDMKPTEAKESEAQESEAQETEAQESEAQKKARRKKPRRKRKRGARPRRKTEAQESEAIESLDLIWGAEAIGQEVNLTERQAFYALENGYLPATKVGKQWVSARSVLRAKFLKSAEV